MQLLKIGKEQKVTAMLPVDHFSEAGFVLLLTSFGWFKRVALDQFSAKRPGTGAISLVSSSCRSNTQPLVNEHWAETPCVNVAQEPCVLSLCLCLIRYPALVAQCTDGHTGLDQNTSNETKLCVCPTCLTSYEMLDAQQGFTAHRSVV